jgi:ribokinase
VVRLHAIGFGSLNLDEFWEVDAEFLRTYDLKPGDEYVKDVEWFAQVYPVLQRQGSLKGIDPGGSAANTIAALRKLGFNTGFCGATGKDDAAALRLGELGQAEDLRVQRLSIPAGRCLALIDRSDSAKDRALVILPNANDLAGSQEIDTAYFEQALWLHLTSFVSRGPLAAQIGLLGELSEKTRVSFDPGAVYSAFGLAALRPLLERTDVLFTTEEELKALTSLASVEDAVTTLIQIGVKAAIVKMGAKGLKGFETNRSFHQEALPPAEIKDRTGAGDVAAAGFIAGMIHSLSMPESLELAALAASRSIEGYGRSCYPDEALLQCFLSKVKQRKAQQGVP